MRVVIVGGGIGGVAAAVALRNAGIESLVLEQAPELSEVGAGVTLFANGMKAVRALGVYDEVRAMGVVSERVNYVDFASGELLFMMELGAGSAARFGEYACHVHRADLLEALAAPLPEDAVRTGCRVVGVEETPDDVRVLLDGGEELRADVVIGADGLKSPVRASLFGEQEPRYLGVVGWRTLLPADRVSEQLKEGPALTTFLGAGRTIVVFPVRDDLYNYVDYYTADATRRESWMQKGDVNELRGTYGDACEMLREQVMEVREPFVTALYFRDLLDTWSTPRVTLVGDAAHPLSPTAGNGAAMALEDGVTLGACVRRAGLDHVADAFRDYERRRIDRTNRTMALARANRRFFFEADPELVPARNGRLRGMQRLDPYGQAPMGWLFEYDAAAAAELPLEQLTDAGRALVNPLERPEAQRAFDLWKDALSFDDHEHSWISQRAGYQRFLLRECPPPSDVAVQEVDYAGIPALRVGTGDGPIVLHLHGGAYTMGSAQSSIELAARISATIGGVVIVPDYRLAPEHPYPAALQDTLAVYHAITDDQPVVVFGECAGGGLALSLAISLRDNDQPLPAAIHVVSPFCDLSLSAASITDNAHTEPWLNHAFIVEQAASYIHATEPTQPLVSPLHADLTGLPPLLIHAAANEALRDDATRLAHNAQHAGVPTTLHLIDDTVHSFILFDFLPETHQALDHLKTHTQHATTTKTPN